MSNNEYLCIDIPNFIDAGVASHYDVRNTTMTFLAMTDSVKSVDYDT